MAVCPNGNLFTGQKKSVKRLFADVTRHFIDTISWHSELKSKDVYLKKMSTHRFCIFILEAIVKSKKKT